VLLFTVIKGQLSSKKKKQFR